MNEGDLNLLPQLRQSAPYPPETHTSHPYFKGTHYHTKFI